MAVEISEFSGLHDAGGNVAQIAGPPINVTQVASGAHQLQAGTELIRIKPLADAKHTVTWPNSEVETFDSTEFRGVNGGSTLTLSAAL